MEDKNSTRFNGEYYGFAEAQEYVLCVVPGIVRMLMEEFNTLEREREQKRKKQYKIMRNELKALFEQYRESESGGLIRTVVDMLLRVNMKCAPPNDEDFRKRHNVVVLRYITEKPMTDKEICKRIGIPTWTLEDRVNVAIGDMMLSFYGVDILDVLP